MVKEVWDSFKDNIKERVTNPFLGTFLLVWIVHNWRVVYAFFNFDKDYKLQNKVDYFNKYWTDHSFIGNLLGVALITVGVLIITYFFLALSRFLSSYFENVIIPYIHKISKGNIVTSETHLKALDKIQTLEEKIETERKAKNAAIAEREELERKLYQPQVIEPGSNNEFVKQIKEFKTIDNEENIENTILSISNGNPFLKGNKFEGIEFLLKHGFIEVSDSDSSHNVYRFTDTGNEFKRQYFNSN